MTVIPIVERDGRELPEWGRLLRRRFEAKVVEDPPDHERIGREGQYRFPGHKEGGE